MRIDFVVFLCALAPVFAGNDCPITHPYAYRPGYGYDYCCAWEEDRNGKKRSEAGADKNSCRHNEYRRCPGGRGCANNDIAKPNTCPESHPYAYRAAYSYDYCCKSDRDWQGVKWSEGGDPNSCMANKYAKCQTGTGCITRPKKAADGTKCSSKYQCEANVCFQGECVSDPPCAIGDRKGGVRPFGGTDACVSDGNGVRYCSSEDTTCCYSGVPLVWDDSSPVPAWHCGKKKDSEFCEESDECESNICFKGTCVADPPCVVFGWGDSTSVYFSDKKGGVRAISSMGADMCISNGNGLRSCTGGSALCCEPGAKLVKIDQPYSRWECEGPEGPDMYDLKVGGACKSGYSPLTSSWQDCESAAKSLGYTGDSVRHVAYDASRRWGTSKPQGCYKSANNGRFHFNRAAGGVNVPDSILCKRDEPEAPPSRDSKMKWCPRSGAVIPHGGKPLELYVNDGRASSLPLCQVLCDNREGCNAMVFEAAKKRCWLYGGVPATKKMPKNLRGRMTMVKLCADFYAYDGKCTYQGVERDLQQLATDKHTIEECEAHCLSEVGCLAYEFNDVSKKCDLHTRPVDGGDGSSDVACFIMEGEDFLEAEEDLEAAEEMALAQEAAVGAQGPAGGRCDGLSCEDCFKVPDYLCSFADNACWDSQLIPMTASSFVATEDDCPAAAPMPKLPYTTITEGTCEDAGMSSLLSDNECKIALKILGKADTWEKQTHSKSRYNGCFTASGSGKSYFIYDRRSSKYAMSDPKSKVLAGSKPRKRASSDYTYYCYRDNKDKEDDPYNFIEADMEEELGQDAYEAATVAMNAGGANSGPSTITYGFAALGFAVAAYGAFKHFTKNV